MLILFNQYMLGNKRKISENMGLESIKTVSSVELLEPVSDIEHDDETA